MSFEAVLSIILLCSIDYMKVSATSHRKGPCDSIGGTIKHLASPASLQHSSEKQTLSQMILFEFATENIMGILFEFVNAEEIVKESHMLKKHLLKTVAIIKHHTFIPLTRSKANLTIQRYSPAS